MDEENILKINGNNSSIEPPIELSDEAKDFETIRNNLFDLIDKGNMVVDMSMQLAERLEDPKMISKIGEMISELTKANLDVIKMYEMKHKIEIMKNRKTLPEDGKGGITNILNKTDIYVGTTKDLNELIKKTISNKDSE